MGAAAKRDRQPGADDAEVAYAASHDLRAPIVAIGQLVESIQLEFDGELPEEVVRRLSLIRARADRCDELLRRLNRYWRADDTSQAASPVDLVEMVADIARHLAPPPEASVEAETAGIGLRAPRRPLRQILCELVDNAIRHAGRRDVRVRVAVSPRSGGWELSVSDNGAGIPAGYRERVWRLFTTLQARGTSGLGLAIVRRIAQAHGGRTWIDQAPEGGARIGVFWPAPAL